MTPDLQRQLDTIASKLEAIVQEIMPLAHNKEAGSYVGETLQRLDRCAAKEKDPQMQRRIMEQMSGYSALAYIGNSCATAFDVVAEESKHTMPPAGGIH